MLEADSVHTRDFDIYANPSSPDATLLANCGLLFELRQEIDEVMDERETIEDERRTDPRLGTLLRKRRRLLRRLTNQPKTMDGARALARVALAEAAIRDAQGRIRADGGPEETCMWNALEFFVRR